MTTLYITTFNGKIRIWSIYYDSANSDLVIQYGFQNGKISTVYVRIFSTETKSLLEQADQNMNKRIRDMKRKGYTKDIGGHSLYGEPMKPNYWKSGSIKFPCWVSPKLDGVSMITVCNNKGIFIYTRTYREIVSLIYIKDELSLQFKDILEDYNLKELRIIGELYNHNMSKQDIQSMIGYKDTMIHQDKCLKYYLYDVIMELSTDKRLILLDEFMHYYKLKYTLTIDHVLVYDEEGLLDKYEEYLDDNYEGIVVKRSGKAYEYYDCMYKPGHNNNSLKMKPGFDEEGTIIDYKIDAYGGIMFLILTDYDIEFTLIPLGSIQERIDMLDDWEYIHKERYMYQYLCKSNSGKPMHITSIGFRNKT